MLQEWSSPLLYSVGVLASLELVYVLLRRSLPRVRLRLLYHLWALSLAGATALRLAGTAGSDWLWPGVAAAAALLSAIVLFALFDALILERPWAPAGPPMLPKLVRDVIGMALFVTVGLLVAKLILRQPLGAVLVSSTVLSAVVGLALQDVLKNVFAGVALDIEKPVARGDWLMLDGKTPVQVVDVSWRSMRLRTKEGVEISEPNANVSAARLVNYGSGARPRGVLFEIGLPYEAPPAEVERALLAAASSVEDALAAPAPQVFLESFDDHAIRYAMRVWTHRVGDLRTFRSRVNARIWYQVERRGLYVPFPIRTVHVHQADAMAERRRARELNRAVELLTGLGLFGELDPAVIRELATAADWRPYGDGEVLVREGEAGDSLFVLESGAARVTKLGGGGRSGGEEVQVAALEAGDFFGERSLLTGEDRSATVTSAGGCVVLGLSKEAVAPILEKDPGIAETLSRALAARQAETEATLESHRDRLARAGAEGDARSMLGRIRSFFGLR